MNQPVSHVLGAHPSGYHRIVVAVGSDGGRTTIELARALAAPDAVFVLARVHHPEHRGELSAHEDAGLDDISAAIEVLRTAREAAGQDCEIVTEPAPSVVVGLHRIAEEERADLLVVGRHRALAGVHAALPAVLRNAPCPVAVAPTPKATHGEAFELRKVGFAFENTPPGRHAADVAATLARSRRAELHGVNVVAVTPSVWSGPIVAGIRTLQRLEGTLADVARASIAAAAPSAQTHVLEGDPVDQLATFASTVDLLVLGTRSAGPLRRLATGSTAEALSVCSPCALLVTAGDDADPS